ncbi:MAG: type IV toxin-antitoxin system AbiEi family antitoxin domain-containing protein [Rhodoglobus sp.]
MEYVPDLLTLSRDLARAGVPAMPYQRAADRGRLLRVHRGVYAPADQWAKLTETERYTHRVLGAVLQSRSSPIVSHISAAVLNGAPIIGPMPGLIHVLCTVAAGTRTEHGIRKHASVDLTTGVDRRGQLVVTSVARTVVEVAADCSFTTAVGVADWALARGHVTKLELRSTLHELGIRRGRSRALRVFEFADERSGSPGESLSRVRIHEAGFPPPVLQQRFEDTDGLAGIVDFWWPDHNLIGEFDGVAKYVREELTQGKDITQIVLEEKWREDRLRACGPRVTRWDWSTAWSLYGLYRHLVKAGLPSSRRSAG